MSSHFYNNWDVAPSEYMFNPLTLMTPGDGSFWYDFGDWDYMFTDEGMTTPISAAGQAVAAVKDKGPNGYDLTQETSSRRPVSTIQTGYKCLDFDIAASQCLYTVSTVCDVAINTCHGWVVFESDDNSQFKRLLSVGNASGSDTTTTASFCAHDGDNTGMFGIRGNGTVMDPKIASAVQTPFGLFEYQINGANSATVWRDGAGAVVDAAHAAMATRSNGRMAVGTSISANAQTVVGLMNGRIWQIVHLGVIPSSGDRAKLSNWLAASRY